MRLTNKVSIDKKQSRKKHNYLVVLNQKIIFVCKLGLL